MPDLLRPRAVHRVAILIIASDKGLAGAFNSNVIKKIELLIRQEQAEGKEINIITVGKKAKEYAERSGTKPIKSFWGFGDYSMPEETTPVADFLIHGFLQKSFDEVIVIYTHFRTTLNQETVVKKILPADSAGLEFAIKSIVPEHGRFSETRTPEPHERYNFEYKFEPSAKEIMDVIVPQLLRVQMHHLILESNASEHSARMVAMKSASDNAKDLIGSLTLTFNKARQQSITQELTEITAGREALEN